MPDINLTPELDQFVEACVRSGRYASASEVARAGVRMLQDAEAERTAFLGMLRRAEAEGEAQGFADATEVVRDLDKALAGVLGTSPA